MSPRWDERRARAARLLLAGVAGAFVAARLAPPGGPALVALGLAAAAALLAGLAFDRLGARFGPRHLLDAVLPLAAVMLVVASVRAPLGVPAAVRWLADPLLAAGLAVAWLALARLPDADAPGPGVSDAGAAVAGGLLALGLALAWPAGATPATALALLAAVLAAWRIAWPLEDPVHPGPGPLVAYVPWGEVPARPWPSLARVPLRAPASLAYLAASWALFLWLGEPQEGGFGLDTARYEHLLYEIPDLSRAPLEGLASLVTAPMLNHDPIQLAYVTVLLGLFGVPFELREGSRRAAGVFAAATAAGALVAGVLLHGLVAVWPDDPLLAHAWTRTWSGGSAGAFGLMGALTARARRPAPLFGFFVFWELNVGAWYLRSYTPAFHLTALAVGFLLARRLAPHRS